MGLIVYLSNTQVQVLSGNSNGKSVSVSKVYTMEVPEGSLLNGVIMDSGALSQAMSDFWKENKLGKKGIKLIVTNPHVAVRMVDVPLQSKKKTEEFLKRELADEDKEQVIGFYEISVDKKAKLKTLCTEVAEVSLIKEYDQLFKAAGLELNTINSGIGVTINFLLKEKSIDNKTCIVMNLDGNTITSIFFVKGQYYYSTSRRIFNDVGTEGFARDIASTVNQINQFAGSQRVEEQISDIYLSGMSEADAINCSSTINDSLAYPVQIQRFTNISNVKISDGYLSLNELLYPVAGIVGLKNPTNIMDVVDLSEKKQKAGKAELIKKFIPYGITVVVMVIVTIVFAKLNSNATKEFKKYNSYVKDPYNINEVLKYDDAAARAGAYGKHYGSLYILNQNLNSYPWANSDVTTKMYKVSKGLADIEVLSYSCDTGIVEITASANREEKVNKFVSKLMEDEAFDTINYTGYTRNEDGSLTINLTCILSEIAGKTEEELAREKTDKDGVGVATAEGNDDTTEGSDSSDTTESSDGNVTSESSDNSDTAESSDSSATDTENSDSDSAGATEDSSTSGNTDSESSDTSNNESGVE
ncbi:MAG: hypothetical protein K6G11_06115 [Lachnospiraceae bacterium]|nr:hypothetical protein [Lachnospiraceae bacterium]